MKNERVIVIGGSSGIGKAVAIESFKQGAQVTVTGLTEKNFGDLKSGYPNIAMKLREEILNKYKIFIIRYYIYTSFVH